MDSKGDLWLCSNGGGVFRYNGNNFEHFSIKNGLCHDQVYAIIEDSKNNIWFGTEIGLCKYNDNGFTHISIPFIDTSSVWLDKVYPVINPNSVHALVQDKQGIIWIGTGGGGAYSFNGKNFTPYLTDIGTKQTDSLYHNWIPSIEIDDAGAVWFASMTHGGASRYKDSLFTHFSITDGLSDDMVRTIYQSKSGHIWFGFNGNRLSGLTKYDGHTFSTLSEKDGLCTKNIRALFEDEKGTLWVGGQTSLCIYDGQKFQEFLGPNKETFTIILFVIEDNETNIWFGGHNGLWQYDGNTTTSMTN